MKKNLSKMAPIIVFFLLSIIIATPGFCKSKHNWSWYTSIPAAFPHVKGYQNIINSVKDKTGGQLDIKLFSAGQLPYKMEDELSVVSKGRVELCDVNNQHVSGYRDWMGVTSLPIAFKDLNEANEMFSGPIMDWTNSVLMKNENCVAIAPVIMANQSVWAKPKIASLEDLKGKRIRTPDATAEMLLKELGAHPVYMQFAEMNEAVMRGTIDGVLTASHISRMNPSWTNIYHSELLLEVNYNLSYLCVNLDAWNELSKDFQNILREEALKETTKLSTIFFNQIGEIYEIAENPTPELTVSRLSQSEKQKLEKTSEALIKNWLDAPVRSAEAKELWALIQKLKK